MEFLLWGQDLDPVGPGNRPFTDYVLTGKGDGDDENGDKIVNRRRQYLDQACGLIVQHLDQLVRAWHPETGAYRKGFLAEPIDKSARKILTGMLVLSGFELGGERMAVAHETMEQEDEHSCFSDTSKNDMVANQEGIAMVWSGSHPVMKGVGFRQLAMAADPRATEEVDRLVDLATKAMRGLPHPFDKALNRPQGHGPDPEARAALLKAITSAEEQASALAAVGLAMGQQIPMRPGG